MPRTGRPAKPTVQLRREGTFDTSRHSDRVDDSYDGVPEKIRGLGKDGLYCYEMITGSTPPNILVHIDSLSLFGLCKWWAEFRDWERKMSSPVGTEKDMRNAGFAWDKFSKLASEYGLTPASRTKLRANNSEQSKTAPGDPLAAMIESRAG